MDSPEKIVLVIYNVHIIFIVDNAATNKENESDYIQKWKYFKRCSVKEHKYLYSIILKELIYDTTT